MVAKSKAVLVHQLLKHGGYQAVSLEGQKRISRKLVKRTHKRDAKTAA